jgi:hypothetical protein
MVHAPRKSAKYPTEETCTAGLDSVQRTTEAEGKGNPYYTTSTTRETATAGTVHFQGLKNGQPTAEHYVLTCVAERDEPSPTRHQGRDGATLAASGGAKCSNS